MATIAEPAGVWRPAWRVRGGPVLGGDRIGAVLAGLVALAVAALAVTVLRAPVPVAAPASRAAVSPASRASLPPASLVEPMAMLPVAADEARRINAEVPILATALAPAAPYRFVGTPADRAAATACLTAAVLYEAGDDTGGEAAVAQVVLNRLRHPAFAKTVCGVIFQGAERATGCQFTFACDGSLARPWPNAAWTRAQAVASAALAGGIDPRVGTATHYHTDWVVPAWSAQLDKIAQVGTHLFFRWKGGWGAPAVFVGVRSGAEVVDPRLAARFGLATPPGAVLSVADEVLRAESAPVLAAAAKAGVAAPPPHGANLRGARLHLADDNAGVFVLALSPGQFAGDYGMASLDLCRGRSACTVVGYLHADRLPSALPLPRGAAAQASFYYDGGEGRGYWNCAEISRANPADCIPGTAAVKSARDAAAPRAG